MARIGAWVTRIDGRVTRIDDAAAAARCRRRLSERLSGRRGRADDLSESLRWAGSGGHSDPSNHPSHSDPSDHPSLLEPLPYKGSRRPCTGNNNTGEIFEAASTHVRGDPPGQRAPGEL